MSPEVIKCIEEAIAQLGTDATQQTIADKAGVSRGSVQRYVTKNMNGFHAQPLNASKQTKSKSTAETQATDYVSVFDRIPLWGYGLAIVFVVAIAFYVPSALINHAVKSNQHEQDNNSPGY